jgi:hypothetical protein
MRKFFVLPFLLFFSFQIAGASSIDVSVGGAFTFYAIPTINYYSYEYVTPVLRTSSEDMNLLFGLALSVPVSVTYNFNNGWGIGGSMELGYSFQAGPHVYSRYAPPDYAPTDYAYMYNAFYGLFDFRVRSPYAGYGIRAVMEFGVVIRPGALIGFYRADMVRFAEGPGSNGFRALCYAGPNFFIGFQKEVARSLILEPGFRFSGEFAGYQNHNDVRYYQNEFYVQANFAIELKIMWNKNIPLYSPGDNATKSTHTNNSNKVKKRPKKQTKPKTNTNEDDDYK